MQINKRIQFRIQHIISGAMALKAVKEIGDSDVAILHGIRKSVDEVLEALPRCGVCQNPKAGLITFGRGSGLEHLGRLCRPCALKTLSGESHTTRKGSGSRKPSEKRAGQGRGSETEADPAPVAVAARKGTDEVARGTEEDIRARQVSEVSGLGLEETVKVVSIMEEAAIPMPRDSMVKNVQQELKGEKDAAARFDSGKIEAAVTEYYRLKGAERVGGDPNRPRRKVRR
jgi:hypothetical protein